MLRSMRKRVGLMQLWPALRNLLPHAARAAACTWQSSNTNTGAWPPNSIVVGFICRPARAASCLPTAVEPVNEILRTVGWGTRYAEISAGVPNTRLTPPAGTPASTKARTTSAHDAGVSSGPFAMMEQPAANAPNTLRTLCLTGSFQGVTAATG